MRRWVLPLSLALALIALRTNGVLAQQQCPVTLENRAQADAAAQAEAVMGYWTPERMTSAQPRPIPTRLIEERPQAEAVRVLTGDPGVVNGQRPGGRPYIENKREFKRSEGETLFAPQTFGTAPTNPRD